MNISLNSIFEAAVLSLALSVDAFIACFAYGNQKISIPRSSAAVISGICSGVLFLSALLGSFLAPRLSPEAASLISFAILFILGLVRLFDSTVKAWIRKDRNGSREFKFTAFNLNFILNIYASPEIADADASRSLSAKESLALSLALSLDGIAAGIGAGISQTNIIAALLFSLLFSVLSVALGCHAGKKVAEKSRFDFSWLGGILLIILAIMKIV